jgi:hypothetical protein
LRSQDFVMGYFSKSPIRDSKSEETLAALAGPSEDGRYVRATAKSRSLGKLGMTIVVFEARDRWLRTAHKASEENREEGEDGVNDGGVQERERNQNNV